MSKMQNFRILIILSILVTSACSSKPKEWSCRNADSKVGCASISKADDVYLENGKYSSSTTATTTNKINPKAKYSSFEDPNLGQTRLVRIPEKVGRLWMAPYMDTKGNYHEASFIRVIDSESKWERENIGADQSATLVNFADNPQKLPSTSAEEIEPKEEKIDLDQEEQKSKTNNLQK